LHKCNRRAAYEEAEHAAKFAELLGEVVTDSTKKNLEMRVEAENGATAGKMEIAKLAKELGLGGYLKLGRGEEAGGGRERQSILADAMEAVLAAVYLDGGIEAARELIERVLLRQAPTAEERRDYKTTLQEVTQRRSGQVLTYHMVDQRGPDHNKTFLFEVRLNGTAIGRGEGHSKKEAEQAAAKAALSDMPA